MPPMRYAMTPLGVSGALAPGFKSNYIVAPPGIGQGLVIDCGGGFETALNEHRFTHRDIAAFYISHLDGDHCAGLEAMALRCFFDAGYRSSGISGTERQRKPVLFVPAPISAHLWRKMRGGCMERLQEEKMRLSDYFQIVRMRPDREYRWQHFSLYILPVPHVRDTFTREVVLVSYALFMTHRGTGKTTLFSTDTCDLRPLAQKLRLCSMAILDCELAPFPSGVHLNYWRQLRSAKLRLRDGARRRIYFTHWMNGRTEPPVKDARKRGFGGFLRPGQTLMLP